MWLSPFAARPIQRCWRTRLRSTRTFLWKLGEHLPVVECNRHNWCSVGVITSFPSCLEIETAPFFCVYPVFIYTEILKEVESYVLVYDVEWLFVHTSTSRRLCKVQGLSRNSRHKTGGRGRKITAVTVATLSCLAYSHFHLFLHLNKHLASQKFHGNEVVKNEVTT